MRDSPPSSEKPRSESRNDTAVVLSSVEFARISKALADPQRCDLLQSLAHAGELCCSMCVSKFSISQATISHHLKELTQASLVERRKEGQFAYYRFRADVMAAYTAELRRRMGLPT